MRRAPFALLAGAVLATTHASAITRDEVIVRAKAFAFHPWKCSAQNLKGSCNSSYASVYLPGDYMGLPYDWGGYMTLFDFDQQIAQGLGAGSYPADGVLACTAGLDCSGFVSQAWGTGHFATATLHNTSTAIEQSAMKPGDVFNKAGYHVAMFSHKLASGEPVLYEAVGYNTHLSMPGWSWVQGYTPRKLNGITGEGGGSPVGTPDKPIDVSSFPFSDQRDTKQSLSDVLDGCNANPSKKVTGAEYIYRVVLTKPGTLTATVQDDADTDIDVHLYGSMNTNDCTQRHDNTISSAVGCGTYYVVADTFKGTKEMPGPYSIAIDFKASGGPCNGGPPVYDFAGGLGDPCAYPKNEKLPFCNPNLGAQTCIYTSSTSFCSKPCASNIDCPEFAGGCCGELAKGQKYCFTAPLCGSSSSSASTGSGPSMGTGSSPPPMGDPNGSASAASGGEVAVSSAASGPGTSGAGGTSGFQHTTEESASCQLGRGSDRRAIAFATLILALAAAARRREAGAHLDPDDTATRQCPLHAPGRRAHAAATSRHDARRSPRPSRSISATSNTSSPRRASPANCSEASAVATCVNKMMSSPSCGTRAGQ
jgi:hypothetical protein